MTRRLILAPVLLVLLAADIRAEQGMLVIHVSNPKHQPVSNLELATEGDGFQAKTDPTGKARIRLAPQTRVGSYVTLQITRPPQGKDLAFISPYDSRVIVPSFENESDNYVSVVVAERGDRMILESGTGVLALVRDVIKRDPANFAPAIASRPSAPSAAVVTTSAKFGLPSSDVQAAIARVSTNPLVWKSIALTTAFEGTSFTTTLGNIDGGGITFGLLLWTFRANQLQTLLLDFRRVDQQRFDLIAGDNRDQLLSILNGPEAEAINFGISVNAPGGKLSEPWRSILTSLGQEPAFQKVQIDHLSPWIERAARASQAYGFRSERAFALFFDTQIQSGGFKALTKSGFDDDVAQFTIKQHRPPDEVERMVMLVSRSVQSGNAFRSIMVSRRMTIALGKGKVYGREYNLEELGLGLRDVVTGAPLPLANDAIVLAELLKNVPQ